MTGLIAHKDTSRVSYDVVKSIPTPARTDTWGVIGHGDFVDLIIGALHNTNHDIINQSYSVSKDGGKLFGVLTLDIGNEEGTHMVGFRNSINKTLAAGLTAGRRVLVCDNLVFSGEFVDYYKHIGKLTLESLQHATTAAIETIAPKLIEFEQWHHELHHYKLTPTDAQTLTFRAIESKVISAGNFSTFYKLFFEKENEQNNAHYENTLFGFHGVITQMWGKNSLISAGSRHGKLINLMKSAISDLDAEGKIRPTTSSLLR